MSTTIHEHLLTRLNNFREVNFASEQEAIALKFMYLMLKKPGSNPEDPLEGINIRQYAHEYMNDTVKSVIYNRILDQQTKYLPAIKISNINIDLVKNIDINGYRRDVFIITVDLYENNNSYNFVFSVDNKIELNNFFLST